MQGQIVDGALIREGLWHIAEVGVDSVFVLGRPAYYPGYGFRPAGAPGMNALYPIPGHTRRHGSRRRRARACAAMCEARAGVRMCSRICATGANNEVSPPHQPPGEDDGL